MENNGTTYSSMIDGVYSLTTDQLEELQDIIHCTIEARKNEEMLDLKEKAMKAMKDFYNAGGGFYDDDNGCLVFMVENAFDDDYCHIHLR